MKTKQFGFTALELVTYIAVLALLATVTMQWIVTTQVHITKQARTSCAFSNVCAAWDVLIRDLQQAPRQRTQWKQCVAGSYIWTTKQGDIGWTCTKEGLIRSQGTYNTKNKNWTSQEQALVTQSVTQCSLELIEQGGVVEAVAATLHARLEQEAYKQTRTIALQSGTLL